MKDVDEDLLTAKNDADERWKHYFDCLLKLREDINDVFEARPGMIVKVFDEFDQMNLALLQFFFMTGVTSGTNTPTSPYSNIVTLDLQTHFFSLSIERIF